MIDELVIELAKSDTGSGGSDDAFWDRGMSGANDQRVHLCETCAEPYVALEALRK